MDMNDCYRLQLTSRPRLFSRNKEKEKHPSWQNDLRERDAIDEKRELLHLVHLFINKGVSQVVTIAISMARDVLQSQI